MALSTPLVICINGRYIQWLPSNSAPGTPGVGRDEMQAHLIDQGFNEERVRTALGRAWLHETSDPNVTIEVLIASAQTHHAGVRTRDDVLSWANRA